MAEVGFGTGYLNHKLKLPLKEVIVLYSDTADAIEINFGSYNELINFELNRETAKMLRKFSYVSIHAPSKEIVYGNTHETKLAFEKIKYLSGKIKIKGIVIHPSSVEDFSIFNEFNLPFLVENMDKMQEKFTNPQHFSELRENYNFGFVLDLQHAYEHDSSMKLCKELIEIMGNRLKELHVSGMNTKLHHALVHCSDNKEAISSILKLKLNIPIILEGAFSEPLRENMKKELDYVRSFYS